MEWPHVIPNLLSLYGTKRCLAVHPSCFFSTKQKHSVTQSQINDRLYQNKNTFIINSPSFCSNPVWLFLRNKRKYFEKYLWPHSGSQLGLKLFGPQRSSKSFTDLERHEDEKNDSFHFGDKYPFKKAMKYQTCFPSYWLCNNPNNLKPYDWIVMNRLQFKLWQKKLHWSSYDFQFFQNYLYTIIAFN